MGIEKPVRRKRRHSEEFKDELVRACGEPGISVAGIALANGVRYAYTGNVFDAAGQSTYCHRCGALVIERDWYRLGRYRLTDDGHCEACGTRIPGVFAGPPGKWGARRLPVVMSAPV